MYHSGPHARSVIYCFKLFALVIEDYFVNIIALFFETMTSPSDAGVRGVVSSSFRNCADKNLTGEGVLVILK